MPIVIAGTIWNPFDVLRLSPRERLLERVALLYFQENFTQERIGLDEEVRHLFKETSGRSGGEKVSPSSITRLLAEARTLGVASISVNGNFAVMPDLNASLSSRMEQEFRLQQCFVVGSDGEEWREPSVEREPSSDGADERRLVGLANYCALKVKDTWAPGDHIATTGGRTLRAFALAMRRNPPKRRDLIFSPLSGRIWMEEWSPTGPDLIARNLDSDDVIHILSDAFEDQGGVHFSLINQPLYPSGVNDRDKTAKAHAMLASGHYALAPAGEWHWNLPPVSKAYVGLGSFASDGHRLRLFLDLLRTDKERMRASYLNSVTDALSSICSDSNEAGFQPLCDLGNRLFLPLPIPRPGQTGLYDEAALERFGAISGRVEALNQRAIVMQWNHLRRAKTVHVLSGGKAAGLFTVLLAGNFHTNVRTFQRDDSAPIVNAATTDRETAHAVLEAFEILKMNPDLMTAYERACLLTGLVSRPL